MPLDDLGSAPTAGATQPELAPTADSPPTIVADRYTILGLLGVGGMGRVYRVRDDKLDEIVALKMLRRELVGDAEALERFRREVKLARRVTSEHVVRTFDLGQHGDEQFLTMELVDGRSLAQLLDDGRLPVAEVLRIARAMCAGIAAAHAAGVLHRDLKPDNVLVAKTGRIAITDFGIALASADRTREDRLVGTPAYMAPEQVEGGVAIGPAADVYACGVILFEMLTGRRPFTGTDAMTVALARLHEPPPDPRATAIVPDSLAELTLRCLARTPAARFADASVLAQALATIAEVARVPAGPNPYAALPAKTSRAIAMLPFKAAGDLVEIADGLSEEIVDTLAMTRELRVVPLASVRLAGRRTDDPRELGRSLDVDVIVDGSIRRRGDAVRILARAVGVADGFQLWANRFDTTADALLTAGDDVARAIANALTVEIEVPARVPPNARATELYLEGKAKLRAGWFTAGMAAAIADLDQARALAPETPSILATLALALARNEFLAGAPASATTHTARTLAERAVALAPASGESLLALGMTSLYEGSHAAAAVALARAVTAAPGLVMAQATLGALLLEVGAIDNAIAHLEAAAALDPLHPQNGDLPRAYIYAGRADDAFRLLERSRGTSAFAEVMWARFKMWRGELAELRVDLAHVPGDFLRYAEITANIHRTRALPPGDRDELSTLVEGGNPRLRATRMHLAAEHMLFVGDVDTARRYLETSVATGLVDRMWMQRCPMLEPLRSEPRFQELAAIVERRAEDVLVALRASLSS